METAVLRSLLLGSGTGAPIDQVDNVVLVSAAPSKLVAQNRTRRVLRLALTTIFAAAFVVQIRKAQGGAPVQSTTLNPPIVLELLPDEQLYVNAITGNGFDFPLTISSSFV